MTPRPMMPTGSRPAFLVLCCEPADARLALCRERRACLAEARLRGLASGGGPGVEVAIVFLEGNGRVEHRADVVRGEHLAFGTGRGNPAVADQNDSLNLGDDFLDVMRDQDDGGSGTCDLPHAL